jgi:uncharacterized damage-inducible protein DinB
VSETTELLFADFPMEHAATRRVLERYPDGKGEWRPHEKSRTIGALATHVADIVNRGSSVLDSEGMDVMGRQPLQPFDTAADLVAHFDSSVQRFNGLLAAADLDSLARPWTIRRGDAVIVQGPRRMMLRTLMMSHLVHHRAQLGVYYRLLGIPVPGVYGPSADEMLG